MNKEREITELEHLKTAEMKLIEIEHGRPIEEIIGVENGSVRDVGLMIGKSHATISLWRKRLGMASFYTEVDEKPDIYDSSL